MTQETNYFIIGGLMYKSNEITEARVCNQYEYGMIELKLRNGGAITLNSRAALLEFMMMHPSMIDIYTKREARNV